MNSNNCKIGAVVLTVILIGTAFFVPASSVKVENINTDIIMDGNPNPQDLDIETYKLDRSYHEDPPVGPLNLNDNDDAGHKDDAGDEIRRSVPIYPGEMEDNWPGRGRTGKLNGDDGDEEDWFFFSACEGQDIECSLNPPTGFNYDLILWDEDEVQKGTSTNPNSDPEQFNYNAEYTGRFFLQVVYISGTGEGQYSFDVDILGQNDLGLGVDAGDDFASATDITPGEYYGYLDINDEFDWYKFYAEENEGVHFELNMKKASYLSDFDIFLYSPNEELVYYENYYYDDEMFFPITMTGEWRIKICIFPGYSDIPEPTEWDYFTYGSGAYELIFEFVDDAPSPPDPITQPDMTPIAQTFVVQNDDNSNKDEFGYMAAIPACNYREGGKRYAAPIIYEGDSTPTNWFGTVDDTTDYLLEDWNNYLSSEGKTANVYNIDSDPVVAAADIAKNNWVSSNRAVVAVDGSEFEDQINEVFSKTRTYRRNPKVETIPGNSEKLMKIGTGISYPMLLGSKWGAIHVEVIGTNDEPSLSYLYPGYMPMGADWWPEHVEEKTDIYHPITTPGFWAPSVGRSSDEFDIKITTLNCDRYKIKVDNPDSALNVEITTETNSDLLVFLVDPSGWLRAPDIPDWNGGEIQPIHIWNGMDNPDLPPDVDDYQSWIVDPHTEFSAEVLHPEEGEWTAIVVPRYDTGASSIKYTITATIREINDMRANAAMSAANAAVIASQEHIPLLYVKENEIPAETQSAFSELGVNEVIFVQLDSIGSAVQGSLPTIKKNLKNIQETIDYIKDYSHSENYIPITSIKSGNGNYAPTAYLAAYHCAPVLRIFYATTESTSNVNPKPVFAGISGDNMFVYDSRANDFTWTYPSEWQPSPEGISAPADSVYLGSESDIILAVDPTDWSLIWSWPSEYVNSEISGENVFYNPESTELIFTEADGGGDVMPLEAPVASNPAGMANRIDTWRLWEGDYYHGNRAPGHLPTHTEPIDIENINLVGSVLNYILTGEGELPPFGLDAKRYWNEALHNGIYEMIKDFGLDGPGQEAYVFVADRKDIRLEAHAVMIGLNSYAGHIPGKTTSYINDIIQRNVLYPALIYANPNRDVTLQQMMNFPDCGQWRTNDGTQHSVCSSRVLKKFFSSHNREFVGHVLWDAHLEAINNGASVFYYSGHGTGGSGMSAQFIQTDMCNYPDVQWPDAWRGYEGDSWKMARDNGMVWYNPEPPQLYDIVHYKHIDELIDNLMSCAVFYMSCSTGQQFGPLVYLDHGAVMWYGNAGSGLCPEADLMDDWMFEDALVYGESVGEAYSKYVWLHFRDFTTADPVAMYGSSTLYGTEGITTVPVIYGDPNLVLYSPDWQLPSPIDSNIGKTRTKDVPNTPTNFRDILFDLIHDFLNDHPILQRLLLSQPIFSKILQR